MPQTINLTLPDNISAACAARSTSNQAIGRGAARDSVTSSAADSRRSATSCCTGSCRPGISRRSDTGSGDAETVPLDQQHQLHDLLLRNQAGMLTDAEREQLAIVQQQADLVMLRKARAAVLLRFRGKRVPTLAELSQLAAMDK